MKGIQVKSTTVKANTEFSIVGIGSSAGGQEAMFEFLKHLPAKTGMAYIYITHLNPNIESRLTAIFARYTKLKVVEAGEKTIIKPDHLYIIPPNRDLVIRDKSFALNARAQRPESHLPINIFFNSLAESKKEKAIGILLSGNPPDGTQGLKAIRAAGRITFAQDSSALFQGMPKNAIAEEVVDLVLSPKQIAEELSKLAQQQASYQHALREINEDILHERDEDLQVILKMIHRLTGVDFNSYKINTIKRRILRRMILHKMDNLPDYVQFMKHHANEVHQLYQDLLINVTSFFRDEDSVTYLRKYLFPGMVKAKMAGEPIRIWVPACSTGQEAYSLAILLMEVLGEKSASTTVQVFATDLSELAINKARLGIYSKDEVSEVSAKKLEKFFTKIDGSYRIIKSIRDLCIFATHNVLKDPPFSRLDLISCSNLLIYLEPVLQKRIISTFHYALNPNGFLVLGKSETIGNSLSLFGQVDKKHKIYTRKKDVASRAIFEMNYKGGEFAKSEALKIIPTGSRSDDLDLEKAVDELLLKKLTPACVVVNLDLDIMQFRGATGCF